MIGILAGMGPKSTSPFIDKVIDYCQKLYGASNDIDYPHMMIYSCPTPFYADRPIDHDEMKKAIIDGAVKLEKTGVDFIALPCNTAHVYYEEIQQALSVPMLHIVEETIKEIPHPAKSGGFRNRANHPIRHLPKSSEGKWTRSYSQGPLAAGCEPAYRRNQTAKSYAAYTSIVADAI